MNRCRSATTGYRQLDARQPPGTLETAARTLCGRRHGSKRYWFEDLFAWPAWSARTSFACTARCRTQQLERRANFLPACWQPSSETSASRYPGPFPWSWFSAPPPFCRMHCW